MTTKQYTDLMQQAVANFHRAFGTPDRIETPGPLPLDRVELKIALIKEEGIVELGDAINARDEVAVVDALVDTIYVTLGALVEMGHEARPLWRAKPYDYQPAITLFEHVTDIQTVLKETVIPQLHLTMNAQDERTTVFILSQILWVMSHTFSAYNLPMEELFAEVQRANMSKLGADGAPVFSRGIELDGQPQGKILKGPNYSPPDIKSILDRLRSERTYWDIEAETYSAWKESVADDETDSGYQEWQRKSNKDSKTIVVSADGFGKFSATVTFQPPVGKPQMTQSRMKAVRRRARDAIIEAIAEREQRTNEKLDDTLMRVRASFPGLITVETDRGDFDQYISIVFKER